MRNLERTDFITIRCTPKEKKKLKSIAENYSLTTSEFLREATIIAAAEYTTRSTWIHAHEKAIATISEEKRWTTT